FDRDLGAKPPFKDLVAAKAAHIVREGDAGRKHRREKRECRQGARGGHAWGTPRGAGGSRRSRYMPSQSAMKSGHGSGTTRTFCFPCGRVVNTRISSPTTVSWRLPPLSSFSSTRRISGVPSATQ